jgi:hypothetical protein
MTEYDTTEQPKETQDVAQTPADEPMTRERERADTGATGTDGFLATSDLDGFAARWQAIQARFVDEPRQSVHEADALVQEVTDNLTRRFAAERERLEQVWGSGEDVSTEDLRVALQRYRSFFGRLLAA